MSPDNRLTTIERREQEANAVRIKAYRRRMFQMMTRADLETLRQLRELRTGEKVEP